MKDLRLEAALRLYDPPAGVKLWHGGATVVGALRGVGPEEAAWRPAPDRHSIWAMALHVAYWKYAVWRRVTGGSVGGFPRSPANFPDVPAQRSASAWRLDRALVRDYHDRLGESMRGFDSTRLDTFPGGSGKTTYADLFYGIVMHDTYHVGQIQMLKRMYASLGQV